MIEMALLVAIGSLVVSTAAPMVGSGITDRFARIASATGGGPDVRVVERPTADGFTLRVTGRPVRVAAR